eukprot:1137360-Pelagomonas_calceolata.AAC.7
MQWGAHPEPMGKSGETHHLPRLSPWLTLLRLQSPKPASSPLLLSAVQLCTWWALQVEVVRLQDGFDKDDSDFAFRGGGGDDDDEVDNIPGGVVPWLEDA